MVFRGFLASSVKGQENLFFVLILETEAHKVIISNDVSILKYSEADYFSFPTSLHYTESL